MAGEIPIMVGFGLVLAGGYGVYLGVVRRGPYRLVRDTPTTGAGGVDGSGRVGVEGTVETADVGRGTFTSPIAQEECVLSAWSVEEWVEGYGDRQARWRTVASGVWSVPFRLRDDSGSVLVYPGSHAEAASVMKRVSDAAAAEGVTAGPVLAEFEAFPVVGRVDIEKPPPEHIAEFVERERAVSPPIGKKALSIDVGNRNGDRRYYENTIAPGEEVYVLGVAGSRPDDVDLGDPDTLVSIGDGDWFVVSTLRREAVADRLGVAQLLLGAGVVGVLLGIFLVMAGLAT